MMTAVPLDAALVEATEVEAVLLEAPTAWIQMESARGVGAEGGREGGSGLGRLGHGPSQCEMWARTNLVGTSDGPP